MTPNELTEKEGGFTGGTTSNQRMIFLQLLVSSFNFVSTVMLTILRPMGGNYIECVAHFTPLSSPAFFFFFLASGCCPQQFWRLAAAPQQRQLASLPILSYTLRPPQFPIYSSYLFLFLFLFLFLSLLSL